MYWRKKKITYSILIPPLKSEIKDLTEKEAADYFRWYMEHIPERVEYLREKCAEQLNIFLPKWKYEESELVLVWRFFIQMAEIDKSSKWTLLKERKEMMNKGYPKELIEDFLENSEEQLSLQTEYILRDIGMFVGEMFVQNSDKIYWGYYTKPKRDFFVNTPLLQGFEDHEVTPVFHDTFEPVHIARMQAMNLFDQTQTEEDLLNIYRKYRNKIPR